MIIFFKEFKYLIFSFERVTSLLNSFNFDFRNLDIFICSLYGGTRILKFLISVSYIWQIVVHFENLENSGLQT